MAQKDDSLANLFLECLSETLADVCDKKNLYLSYDNKTCRKLMNFVEKNKLPSLEGAWGSNVYNALVRGYYHYREMKGDTPKTNGRIFWSMMKTVYPNAKYSSDANVKADGVDPEKVSKYYSDKWAKKSGVIDFLGQRKLDLTALVKLQGLDCMGYKYKTEEYRALYDQLGSFVLGKNPQEFNTEKDELVKLYHKLFRGIYKSKKDENTGETKMEIAAGADDKIISARFFLVSLARNAALWEEHKFVDVKGKLGAENKIYEIDKKSLKLMNRLVQRHAHLFSKDCLDYFAGKETKKQTGMDLHLDILYNKLENTPDYDAKCAAFQDAYPRINFHAISEKHPSEAFIMRYAGFLFEHAAFNHNQENIGVSVLEHLLSKEVQQHNQDVVDSCLFQEQENIPQKEQYAVNKKLVLGVAKAYAASFTTSEAEGEEFNPAFHKKMTQMFGQIVTENDYTKKEVSVICDVLRSNPDSATQSMAKAVMQTYTTPKYRGGKSGKDSR